MGIELPAELADVAARTGLTWPEADEDLLREQAEAWRTAATRLATLAADADTSADGALRVISGEAGDAARAMWARYVDPADGSLTVAARGAREAAERLGHAADRVADAKVEMVRQLVAAAENADAAAAAADGGHPAALLGLDTLLSGTAANLASVTGSLVEAVGTPGAELVADEVADAHPGARSTHGQTGLLGAVTGLGAEVLAAAGRTKVTGLGPQVASGPAEDRLPAAQPISEVLAPAAERSPGQTAGVPEPSAAAALGPEARASRGDDVPTPPTGVAVGEQRVSFAEAPTPPSGVRAAPGTSADAPTPPAGVPVPSAVGRTVASGSADAPLPPVAGPGIGSGPAPALAPGATPVAAPGSVTPGPLVPGPVGQPQAGPGPVAQGAPGRVPAGPGPLAPGQPPAGYGPVAQGSPGRAPAGPGFVAAGPPAGGGAPFAGPSPVQQAQPGACRPSPPLPPSSGAAHTGPPGARELSRPPDSPYPLAPHPAPQAQAPPEPPVGSPRQDRQTIVALFLVHMFPIGHLPVASGAPARQLPPPSAEAGFAAGLRFPPHDHPESALVVTDPAELRPPQAPLPGLSPQHPAVRALLHGHDPLGGAHERDWDRRYLVAVGARGAEHAWPPGERFPEGGHDSGEAVVLGVGEVIDRFGDPAGRVFAAESTPFARRSLPPSSAESGYHRYRVVRPLPVWRAVCAPWFGQPGGGVRYRAVCSADELVALGFLFDVTGAPEPDGPESGGATSATGSTGKTNSGEAP